MTPRPPAPDGAREVEVLALSSSQWKICDRRWPEHDARNLIGFVEKDEGLFEVVEVDRGLERFSFPTLAEATAHFARRVMEGRRPVGP